MHPYVGNDALRLLHVHNVVQTTNYTCGPAALSTVLGFYGLKRSEDDLIGPLATSPDWGTEPYDMVTYAKSLGFDVIAREISIKELRSFLDQGSPVILPVQEWAEPNIDMRLTMDNGHYVVAVGYVKDGFIFQDPSLETGPGYLSVAELIERWHDYDINGTCLRQWGIVLSRDDSTVV